MPDQRNARWATVVSTFTGVPPATAQVMEALTRGRFRYRNEGQLHEGIMIALNAAGIKIDSSHHEVCLDTPADRIDFLLPGGVGIEVKVDGQPAAVWRQLVRYAASDRVTELLLVTTRAKHAVGRVETTLNGKPMNVLVLRGGLR